MPKILSMTICIYYLISEPIILLLMLWLTNNNLLYILFERKDM
jgi:hypothetical protein